jgi:hypothetical protein
MPAKAAGGMWRVEGSYAGCPAGRGRGGKGVLTGKGVALSACLPASRVRCILCSSTHQAAGAAHPGAALPARATCRGAREGGVVARWAGGAQPPPPFPCWRPSPGAAPPAAAQVATLLHASFLQLPQQLLAALRWHAPARPAAGCMTCGSWWAAGRPCPGGSQLRAAAWRGARQGIGAGTCVLPANRCRALLGCVWV